MATTSYAKPGHKEGPFLGANCDWSSCQVSALWLRCLSPESCLKCAVSLAVHHHLGQHGHTPFHFSNGRCLPLTCMRACDPLKTESCLDGSDGSTMNVELIDVFKVSAGIDSCYWSHHSLGHSGFGCGVHFHRCPCPTSLSSASTCTKFAPFSPRSCTESSSHYPIFRCYCDCVC